MIYLFIYQLITLESFVSLHAYICVSIHYINAPINFFKVNDLLLTKSKFLVWNFYTIFLYLQL